MNIARVFASLLESTKNTLTKNDPHFFISLNKQQTPRYMFISCSDSRVDPGILFNLRPGDAFVTQNIAAWVPACKNPSPSPCNIHASLLFAIENLKVQHIIILGHKNCGGIETMLNPPKHLAKPLADYVQSLTPSKESMHLCQNQPYATIHSAWKNLQTYPCVQHAMLQQTLSLHAWCFDIGACQLEAFDAKQSRFIRL